MRNNILFGLPLDEARLYRVVEVCELTEDIKLFARGLDTEIGERGVNISGGQEGATLTRQSLLQRRRYLPSG